MCKGLYNKRIHLNDAMVTYIKENRIAKHILQMNLSLDLNQTHNYICSLETKRIASCDYDILKKYFV